MPRVVSHLTADRERWHRAMVHDELGVVEDTHINPWREAGAGWPFLCGRWPHPNHTSGPLVFRKRDGGHMD